MYRLQGHRWITLVVQWLRCHTSSARGASLIPDWGTKILLATWPKKEKKHRLGVRPTLCCGGSGVLSCCSSCEGSCFILVMVGGNQEHILALTVKGTDVAILAGSLA